MELLLGSHDRGCCIQSICSCAAPELGQLTCCTHTWSVPSRAKLLFRASSMLAAGQQWIRGHGSSAPAQCGQPTSLSSSVILKL